MPFQGETRSSDFRTGAPLRFAPVYDGSDLRSGSGRQTTAVRAHILVIGYGNELRRDDGLGPTVARAIEALGWRDVDVITAHQLTPELSHPISHADAVVFIDAAVHCSRVTVRKLSAAPRVGVRAHSSAPTELLMLAQRIWGQCPPSWWITVPAFDLSFGEGLSGRAEAHIADAVEVLRELLRIRTAPNLVPKSAPSASGRRLVRGREKRLRRE